MFTEKEMKLARLALNPEAPEGEWQTAAVKLFLLLRATDRNALAEFESNGLQMVPIPPTQPDFGLTVMEWGIYKDQLFKDIPPGWLMAKRDWIRSAPDIMARWGHLAEAIDRYLDQ